VGLINHGTEYVPVHQHESHNHDDLVTALSDVRAELGEIKGLLTALPEKAVAPIEDMTEPVAEAVPVPEPVKETIALPAEAVESVEEPKVRKKRRLSYHRGR
jgi:hypothetical protein